jgi:hypothetical protein
MQGQERPHMTHLLYKYCTESGNNGLRELQTDLGLSHGVTAAMLNPCRKLPSVDDSEIM